MIFIVFLFCFLHLPGNKGASKTNSVLQTPPSIIRKIGESAPIGINCSHNIQYYDVILWYKQDEHKGLKLLGLMNTNSPLYEDGMQGKISLSGDGRKLTSFTISDLQLNDSSVYFCAAMDSYSGYEAFFGGGTKLTVLEREVAEPKVIVLPPSEKECRNKKDPKKKKTLVCVAEDFYPDHVSLYWQVDGENVTDGVATDNFAQQNETSKLYKITSRLRVSATDWFTSGKEFKCIVSFIRPNDTQEIYPASVEGVKPPDTDAMTRETFLKISQSAKLCYGVFIAKSCLYGAFVMFLVWKLQGSTGK